MMWYWGSGYGWGMMLTGILMTLVLWAGILGLGVLLLRSIRGDPLGQREGALDMLRKRLAAGEITPEEYERTRQALEG